MQFQYFYQNVQSGLSTTNKPQLLQKADKKKKKVFEWFYSH